jgi:4-amino-4-deoxy-L-arabinose transferase-like glycosyltransferase
MRTRGLVVAIGVAVIAAAVILPGLSHTGFSEEDEALYAQVAREMSHSGDHLTLRYLGAPFFHKPPLGTWLMAAARSCLGPGELSARLPSALSGVLLVVAVYLTALRIAGVGAGLLAAGTLLLGQQLLFEHGVRSAVFDGELALCSFVLLVAGHLSNRSRSALALAALALGGILMLKAPMAGFPVLALLISATVSGRPRLSGLVAILGGGLLIATPWHLHQLWIHGTDFARVYFGYELLGRFGSTAGPATPGRLVHLEALAHNFEIWTPLLLIAVVAGLSGRWPDTGGGPETEPLERSGLLRLLGVYVVLFLVVLGFVSAKWPWYVLPAYPALAVLGGSWLADALRTRTGWLAKGVVVLLGSMVAARWLLLHADPSYLPAARASVPWPERVSMLAWRWEAGAEASLAVAIALLGTVALRRLSRLFGSGPSWAMAGALLCALVLGRQAADIAQVPRAFEHPSEALAEALAEESYAELQLVGFRLPDRYDGRLEPIPAYYLSGLSDVRIRAGNHSWTSVSARGSHHDGTGRALIVAREAADGRSVQSLARQHPDADVWIYAPGTTRRFWRQR